MCIKKFTPKSPDKALGKTVGDDTLARFGHLNKLVDDINGNCAVLENSIQDKNLYESYNVTTPSGLIDKGASYSYPRSTDGMFPCLTFKSYLVKGIQQWEGSSIISIYLGTLKITPNAAYRSPWSNYYPIFPLPEKLTGMVMASPNLLDPTTDKVVTPLANGAKMWDVDASAYNELQGVQVSIYSYGPPDPVTGEVNFALVLEAYGSVPTYDITSSFISYQVEFNIPTFFDADLWLD